MQGRRLKTGTGQKMVQNYVLCIGALLKCLLRGGHHELNKYIDANP